MSSGINIRFTVTGLADQHEADLLFDRLDGLIRDEGLDDELLLDMDEVGPDGITILADTNVPLIISKAYAYMPDVEQRFAALIPPTATFEFHWEYADPA